MSENKSPENKDERGLLTRFDLKQKLSVGLRTVDQLLADGEIPVVRIGSSIRIRPADLDAFCEARLTRMDSKRRRAIEGKGK